MRPEPGEVLHFSEDPAITRFEPHVASTAQQPEPYPHAFVATEPVEPLGPPEPVGDLLERHDEAGIELRMMSSLWEFWDAVVASTLEFSGIRLSNALPRAHAR